MEQQPAEYEGRHLLVVGASSGIGRAVAVSSGSAGARVALVARRFELIEAAAQEIGDAGGEARAFRCDITDESQCHAMVDNATAWLGGIDTLFYVAGASPLVRIEEATAGVWQDILATNLVGAALVTARTLPSLRDAQDPVVVFTTTSMDEPWPWLALYGSAKAGLAELARGLRSEEPWLRVVCVSVGDTATPFADGWDRKTAERALTQWADEGRLRHRILRVEEMATAILDAAADRTGPDDLLVRGEVIA